jgi:hypothetical protein
MCRFNNVNEKGNWKMLKCPYGCDINQELFVGNHPEIQEVGERIVVCPLCEQQFKIITVFLPIYACEKVEKTIQEKLKKWLSLISDWFGRPSRYHSEIGNKR